MTTYISQSVPILQTANEASSYLAVEFTYWQDQYRSQPALVQRFLDAQGRALAEAVIQNSSQVHFTLPDKVVSISGEINMQSSVLPVPLEWREQASQNWLEWLAQARLTDRLRRRLEALEANPHRGVAAAAGLVRFAMVFHMVHHILPIGRKVVYRAESGEEIPSIPVIDNSQSLSAMTAHTDAIGEVDHQSDGRGKLQVPYVESARRFYLPQWVAFDDQGQLLVSSLEEAEALIASMQHYLSILHTAVSLAPYIIADPEYQQKRYGMLGQLVNQARSLARCETQDIIQEIQRRVGAGTLNRGLSLSLPYFDDQGLEMRLLDMDVIPAGRVMFIPAFIVLACHREQARVTQDTCLSPTTRKHLLAELRSLETAFADIPQ
jgi:hypothetical protein